MEKSEIRKQMRALKRDLSLEEKIRRSENIMRKLEREPRFVDAHVVLLYWSMSDEVQTHAFVNKWYQDKTLLLPCVVGDDLVLRQYTGPDCLVAGEQFGIGEPRATEGGEWSAERVELIVVPGVAFDKENNRMGRGRGFYDRLLKTTPQAQKYGVAFDFQLLDTIPVEPHDVKMDKVISE